MLVVSSRGECLAAAAPEAPPPRPARSTIAFAQDRRAIVAYRENPAVIRAMVDAVVAAATGAPDAASAWRKLVAPADRVGIKISAAGGPAFSTHRSVIDAIVRGLADAGVPARNVVVWDRAGLATAGYRETAGGYAVRTIEPFVGYDLKAVFTAPLEGRLIWGDARFMRRRDHGLDLPASREQVSIESHWAKVLGEVTRIINVPVLAASESCGIAGCLYNATVPNIDNWRRFLQRPGGSSDPYLAELYHDERVARKVVLHIVDGLIAQYAGGPEWQPNYAWHHATIYAGLDPVALDATLLRTIDRRRKDARLPELTPRARFLQTADAMGLGHSSDSRIELKPVRTSGELPSRETVATRENAARDGRGDLGRVAAP